MRFNLSASPIVTAGLALLEHPMLRVPVYLPAALSGATAEPGVKAVPLVFWLMDVLRPRRVLSQIGSHGLVHAACCQAVVEGHFETTCWLLRGAAGDESETLQQLRAGRFITCSKPINDLATVADGSLDLITLPVARAGDVNGVDQEVWLKKRAPEGVLLLYGAGVQDLPPEGVLRANGGAVLRLGDDDAPLLLVLGPEAPELLQALAASAPDCAEYTGVNGLLLRQIRQLELETLARAYSASVPGLSTLPQAAPKTLAEAEAQMARLIEQQAADLEELASECEAQADILRAQNKQHQAQLAGVKANLKRKDAIIARLEKHIAAMRNDHQENMPSKPIETARRKPFWRR